MNGKAKIEVSRFEYAIRSVVEPETLDSYKQLSREEESKEREEKLLNSAKKMKIKTAVNTYNNK